MNWQEFLQQQARSCGLSPEQEDTLLAALPSEDEQRNLAQIANNMNVSEYALKSRSRLGGIYKAFAKIVPGLAETKGAGKLEKLHNFLRQEYARMSNGKTRETITPPGNLPPYPDEFKSLIQEKIARFCGRDFVFEAFEKFLQENNSGYFTLVGDAGMGKSAIAAKYVDQYKCPCYFNILVEGRNSLEQFLKSIRQQLINRYELPNAEADDLPTLLAKAAQKLPPGEKLVIMVDALDEVTQEPGGNLLHLPTTLPERVYFILTRRPYTLENKRLSVSPGVKMKELDLTEKDYLQLIREDIKNYIRLCLYQDPEYKEGLIKWIEERHIGSEYFVEKLADKSENNFMYLRYVLPAIADGDYDNLENLKELPDGLLNYYQNHWERMGMETKEMRKNAIILYVLVVAGKPITCNSIARITKRNKYEILEVLENKDWVGLLRRQQLKGETCYTIYHKSFADFLLDKPTLKINEILLDDIQRLLSDANDRIWEEIEKNEEKPIEKDEKSKIEDDDENE